MNSDLLPSIFEFKVKILHQINVQEWLVTALQKSALGVDRLQPTEKKVRMYPNIKKG